MSAKQKARTIIDAAMTVSLSFLMAYSMIGETAHERLGVAMLILFAAHHVLNFRWFKTLAKRKYTPARIFRTAINLLLCVDMLLLAASGIILSNHVFAFLPIKGLASLAREWHMLGSYWGIVLMSVHIGLHWPVVLGMIKTKKPGVWVSRACCLLVSACGAYAFFARNYGDYMFLKTHFVFLDYAEPLPLFLLDQLAIIVLFAAVGYYVQKLLTLK